MGHSIEAKNVQLRRAMLAFLVSFCALQLLTVLRELVEGALRRPLAVGAAVAAFVWIGVGFQLFRVRRAIHADAAARRALNDERIRELRLRSLTIGYVATIIYLCILRLAGTWVPVPIGVAADVGIFVAVAAPLTAFLLFERSEG